MSIWNCPTDSSGFQIFSEEYEHIDVAHYDQMSYDQFLNMPAWYQEMMIAHSRTNAQKEAVWAFAHKPKAT